MKPTKIVTLREIEWVDIQPGGRELPRRGHIWVAAAPVAGMTAFWVLPDLQDQGEDSGPSAAILVARSNRRHLCGRAYRIQKRLVTGEMGWREMWNPTGGRFVDKGEWFRETDPRSRFNRAYRPPRHAPFVKRADDVALNLFDQVCEKAADGVDLDYTVSERSAAEAANVAHADAAGDERSDVR
jgi:hypothetical protein